MGLDKKQKDKAEDEENDEELTVYNKRTVDEHRISSLSKPKDKERHKLLYDIRQEALKKAAAFEPY
jgi:hypothetical protein